MSKCIAGDISYTDSIHDLLIHLNVSFNRIPCMLYIASKYKCIVTLEPQQPTCIRPKKNTCLFTLLAWKLGRTVGWFSCFLFQIKFSTLIQEYWICIKRILFDALSTILMNFSIVCFVCLFCFCFKSGHRRNAVSYMWVFVGMQSSRICFTLVLKGP